MTREVCFQESDVKLYMFLCFVIIIYLIYIYINNVPEKNEQLSNINLNQNLTNDELQEKLKNIQDKLYASQLSEQQCQIDLFNVKQSQSSQSQISQQQLLNKIYNPLISPERIYPGGRFNTASYSDYQLIGFVYNDMERYPLYGRPKYPGKTDKYEYYIIDESRNRLKIPFKSKNDNELYTGDTINVPSIDTNLNVTIYDYDNIRYDPTVF